MKKGIVRGEEEGVLKAIFESDKAEFVALYGRRRVGKTFLIRQFFREKPCVFFNSTGIHNENFKRQIREFTNEIGRVFFQGVELKEKKDWFETFSLLTEAMAQVPRDEKIVLFFDEFPWMSTPKSKLLQALDFFWNRHWSQDGRIKLIVCGSSASWLIKNIVNDKGGLHNRLTRTIRLDPLTLLETRTILNNMKVRLNDQHIVQIYMMTGGIPYYLSYVSAGMTSSQIIEALAFSKNGPLLDEFDKLYSSLFDDAEAYIEIVRTVANHREGIALEDLFSKIGASRGGTIQKKVKDLEDAGFILSFTPYLHKKRGNFVKVIDEYSLFYLHWIEPLKQTLLKKGVREGYWNGIMNSPKWCAWAGYAFEAICYKHMDQISRAFKLSPASIPGSWKYIPKKGAKEEGAEIDLLFDRDDHAISLCEIKYTTAPFVIDKEYAAALRRKMEVFQNRTKTQKQLFLCFISAQGLKQTIYAEEMVDSIATLEDLFQ